MSFNVKDLSVSLSGPLHDVVSTCSTMTKPTGGETCAGSIFWQQGAAARQRNLAALRTQMRGAMART
jgi:hypothetical protein